jgi:hypothetical protein
MGAFVCKACTVHVIADRELTNPFNGELLALERMRLSGMAHHWSTGTHRTYQGKLWLIRTFKDCYNVHILGPMPLLRPPSGMEIPLMWYQDAYSLCCSNAKQWEATNVNLTFSTVCQLWSGITVPYLGNDGCPSPGGFHGPTKVCSSATLPCHGRPQLHLTCIWHASPDQQPNQAIRCSS